MVAKKNIKNLSVQDFTKICIVICLLGDLLYCFYIWSQFSDFNEFTQQINLALSIIKKVPSFPVAPIPSGFHRDIHHLMLNSIKIMIATVIVIHSTIYFAFYKEKVSAMKYIKFMGWTAGISAFFLASFDMNYKILFFPIGVMYIYVAYKLGKLRYHESRFTW